MAKFENYFVDALKILELRHDSIQKISKDRNAALFAVIFVMAAGFARAIGMLNLNGLIIFPVFFLIMSFIGMGFVHLLAKAFGGKAKFMEYYKPMGLSYMGLWISAIPVLGMILSALIGLWLLAVNYTVLMSVHKLESGKALAVVLLSVLAGIIFGIAFAFMLAVIFSANIKSFMMRV